MASWLKFTSDYDHKHDSRAVTAYKSGDVVYVPTHIARVALTKGKAVETDKPSGKPTDDAGDGRLVYVEDRVEFRDNIAERFKNTFERLDG